MSIFTFRCISSSDYSDSKNTTRTNVLSMNRLIKKYYIHLRAHLFKRLVFSSTYRFTRNDDIHSSIILASINLLLLLSSRTDGSPFLLQHVPLDVVVWNLIMHRFVLCTLFHTHTLMHHGFNLMQVVQQIHE